MNIGGQAYNLTDALAQACGTMVNTALRIFTNIFALATAGQGGGGTDPLLAARVREGCVLQYLEIQSDQNLSTINFDIGVEGDTDKYGAAVAGPNNGVVRVDLPIAAAIQGELATPEDIILTPSANLPSAGHIVTRVFVSKR